MEIRTATPSISSGVTAMKTIVGKIEKSLEENQKQNVKRKVKTKFEEEGQNNPDKMKEELTGRRRSRSRTLYPEVISEEETYLQGWGQETRQGTSPTSSCLASASLTGSSPSSAGSSSRGSGDMKEHKV